MTGVSSRATSSRESAPTAKSSESVSAAAPVADAPMGDILSSEEAESEELSISSNANNTNAGLLTAGEWSDIANWDYWSKLVTREEWRAYEQKMSIYPHYKHTFKIVQRNGMPAVDLLVALHNDKNAIVWTARTDNTGEATVFANFFVDAKPTGKHSLSCLKNGCVVQLAADVTLQQSANKVYHIDATAMPNQADIMFIVDATGSMGDEISYLQKELQSVLQRVKAQDKHKLDWNFSSIFYRDEGDEYVTVKEPFTKDYERVMRFINKQNADGGGDFPEAVDAALAEAMRQDWRSSSVARLVFLLLDAPPHDKKLAQLREQIQQAAKLGIKIIPITASGIDKETEFLMRALAIGSNATYTFITDHSGIGESHLEPTIGDYKVEKLNELILRLIVKYTKLESAKAAS